MMATIDGCELKTATAETADECPAEVAVESTRTGAHAEERPGHGRLPWIGTLPNPGVGPMVVRNDSGYWVPLCTAGDLLRGCRYFWRVYQD